MNKLVSIIVPVYNVENYVEECIKSIVNQFYKNLEIIIIDDGSTDNSAKIIKKWEKIDSRIKYIYQQNKGLSGARNTGIVHAKGVYVQFVDSDDVISPEMTNILVKNLETTNADISVCDYESFNDKYLFDNNENIVYEYDSHEAMIMILKDIKLKQVAWNKLYLLDEIKNNLFPEGKYHEDVFWTYKSIGKAKKICYCPKKLYGYRQRAGSIMNTNYNKKRFDIFEALEERYIYISKNYPDLVLLAKESYANTCLYHYQLLCRLKPKEYKIMKKEIYNKFKKIKLMSITNFNIQFIWITIFRLFPNLTCFIRNKLNIGI